MTYHAYRSHKAVVSTFNFLLPSLSAIQNDSARAQEREDFHSLTALLSRTLSGAFTRDCVLLSALGLCFALRAHSFVSPSTLASNLAYLFFPDMFGPPASPVDAGLACITQTSPLVRVAAARALIGCQDFATLNVPLKTINGDDATLLHTVLSTMFAVVDDPRDGSLHFLALQTLAQWLRGLCGGRGDGAAVAADILAPSSPLRAQLLAVVFAHWEHPVEVCWTGVFVLTLFRDGLCSI